jgi:exodeoxyribonuclease VII large subunit
MASDTPPLQPGPSAPGGSPSNVPVYSVGEISGALKRTIEQAYGYVRVRGEISGCKRHGSGHIYLALKDMDAVIDAVCWRGSTGRLKVDPADGIEVIATGRLTTFPGRSKYQMVIEQMELAGEGALLKLLEERKRKLAAEGLFAAERKRALPYLPTVIGVVTSPTGAVIRDILHRLNERFPRHVLLWPVAVQGDTAADQVARAIDGFNRIAPGGPIPRPDLIIVARGGGSLEDLMAFNEEIVVRAAAESVIPLISAVGHETDTTLIDFASDVRAPTPTAAAEMAVPVRADLIGQSLDYERRLLRCFSKGMEDRRRHLTQLARVLLRSDQLFAQPRQRLDVASDKLGNALRRNVQEHRRQFTEAAALLRPRPINRHITVCGERTQVLGKRMARAFEARLTKERGKLDGLLRVLESVSYKSVLDRGYALVRGEDGSIRRRASQITGGERLNLTFADGDQGAVAEGEGAPKPKPRATKPRAGQGSLF